MKNRKSYLKRLKSFYKNITGKNLSYIILLGVVCLSCLSCSQKEQKPNIVFIMSDDHSTNAISAYGNSLLETPNIDKLSEQGIRFNNCFNVVSLCGPSRAAILSGKYSIHNGYKQNFDTFNSEQVTFPKLLQQAGYETAVIGKWHLGTEPAGFDYYGVIPHQGQFFDCRIKETGQEWQNGGKGGVVQPGYLTEIITDKAIEWLENRDKNKPFCLLVHHKAPHSPYHYPEKYEKILADEPIPEPQNFNENLEGKNVALTDGNCRFSKLLNIDPSHFRNKKAPDSLSIGTQGYKEWAFQHIVKNYHRLVASLDENIGRLMDYVDNSELKENTIVIYTSDNGWLLGEHGLFNKMWMYEESLKVPLIVRYPEEVRAASVSDDFISVLDFAATFLDYAGAGIPECFQGRSIRKVMGGVTPDDWRTAHFYHYYGQYEVPSHYGIRTGDYKLIHFYEAKEEPKWELYNLKNDPGEMVNLIHESTNQEALSDLKKLLQEKRMEYEGI